MKNLSFFLLLGLALTASSTTALGASQPALDTLFPHEAPIEVEIPGLSRLPLPPEVVSACRPDFSDLRVFDPQGNEVPYLVDSGLAQRKQVEIKHQIQLKILAVEQGESRSETAPPRQTETYRLGLAAERLGNGRWDLVLQARARHLIRRVDVTAVGPEGESQVLVQGGSVFRLTTPERQRLRLELPGLEPETTALLVTLTGEDGTYLEPVFHLESSRSIDRHRLSQVPLTELSRQEEAGTTIVELQRPRGLVPDRLLLQTSTPTLHREVVVWDEGPGSSADPLGRDQVFRVDALADVQDLDIRLRVARGDRLRVVIDNGDSPALGDLRFSARLGHPELLLHLNPVADGPDGWLRFGGGRAFLPRYDLAGLVPTSLPVTGQRAKSAERFWDPELLGRAILGPIQSNPRFTNTPALAFAMRPGAEIDARVFSHRRTLLANPSPEGLNRFRLTLQDLAVARPDLGDVRVADPESRQWAYLLEPQAATLRLNLELASQETKDKVTTYRYKLPWSPAAIERIIVETSIPFFDRAFQLLGIVDDEEVAITHGRLSRRIGDPRPLDIAFPTRRFETLELRVENGDDAPLTLTRAQGLFPVPELFFAGPEGPYQLLLGDPEIAQPSYELARIRDVILAVASADVESESLAPNPTFRLGRRLASEKGAQRIFLWTGLVLAVLVLAWITLRVAKPEVSD